MRPWIAILLAAVLIVPAVLTAWRQGDRLTAGRAWNQLAASAGANPATYDSSIVAGLPEPARRYFNFMIEPGTRLYAAVELDMAGEIGLGTKEAPNYRAMSAQQILAPPHGLVWCLKSGPISGSDGALPGRSWTRFWLFGLLPVVRANGPDHRRSAFGRVVAEAAFWAPAGLLPGEHVRWEALGPDSARAVVTYGPFEQAVDITVDETGAPRRVKILRWSNANADKQYRIQPFGGELSEFRRFGGYRLPTRVEGGNHFGTPDYFPFFKAVVTNIRFPGSDSSARFSC